MSVDCLFDLVSETAEPRGEDLSVSGSKEGCVGDQKMKKCVHLLVPPNALADWPNGLISLVSMAWYTKNRNPATALSSSSCTHTGSRRRVFACTAGGAAGLGTEDSGRALRGTAFVRLMGDRVSV